MKIRRELLRVHYAGIPTVLGTVAVNAILLVVMFHACVASHPNSLFPGSG